jgi:hypothetical protein
MEGSKLGGHWNVPCLDAFGRGNKLIKKKTSFSPPSTFYPIKFCLNLSFIDFRVFFYYGSRPLFGIYPYFSLTYKLQSRISRYQVFHTLIAKLILIKDFFLSLNSWDRTWLFYELQATQMNEKLLQVSSLDSTMN